MGREGRNKVIQADGQCSLFQMQVFLCIALDFREMKKSSEIGRQSREKECKNYTQCCFNEKHS